MKTLDTLLTRQVPTRSAGHWADQSGQGLRNKAERAASFETALTGQLRMSRQPESDRAATGLPAEASPADDAVTTPAREHSPRSGAAYPLAASATGTDLMQLIADLEADGLGVAVRLTEVAKTGQDSPHAPTPPAAVLRPTAADLAPGLLLADSAVDPVPLPPETGTDPAQNARNSGANTATTLPTPQVIKTEDAEAPSSIPLATPAKLVAAAATPPPGAQTHVVQQPLSVGRTDPLPALPVSPKQPASPNPERLAPQRRSDLLSATTAVFDARDRAPVANSGNSFEKLLPERAGLAADRTRQTRSGADVLADHKKAPVTGGGVKLDPRVAEAVLRAAVTPALAGPVMQSDALTAEIGAAPTPVNTLVKGTAVDGQAHEPEGDVPISMGPPVRREPLPQVVALDIPDPDIGNDQISPPSAAGLQLKPSARAEIKEVQRPVVSDDKADPEIRETASGAMNPPTPAALTTLLLQDAPAATAQAELAAATAAAFAPAPKDESLVPTLARAEPATARWGGSSLEIGDADVEENKTDPSGADTGTGDEGETSSIAQGPVSGTGTDAAARPRSLAAKEPDAVRLDSVKVVETRSFMAAPSLSTNGEAVSRLLLQAGASLTPAAASPLGAAVPAAPAQPLAGPLVAKPMHTLTIRLSPASLGNVTAVMKLTGDVLTVKLQVETAEAYRQMTEDNQAIVKSLRAQGYAVDQISVQHVPSDRGTAPLNQQGFGSNQQPGGQSGLPADGDQKAASGGQEGDRRGGTAGRNPNQSADQIPEAKLSPAAARSADGVYL